MPRGSCSTCDEIVGRHLILQERFDQAYQQGMESSRQGIEAHNEQMRKSAGNIYAYHALLSPLLPESVVGLLLKRAVKRIYTKGKDFSPDICISQHLINEMTTEIYALEELKDSDLKHWGRDVVFGFIPGTMSDGVGLRAQMLSDSVNPSSVACGYILSPPFAYGDRGWSSTSRTVEQLLADRILEFAYLHEDRAQDIADGLFRQRDTKGLRNRCVTGFPHDRNLVFPTAETLIHRN